MSICSFSVANDFGYGDNKGTNWLRCSIFGKRAEGGLPQYLLKGTQVAISGELRVREYDDRDGNKKLSVEVSVSSLDLIGGRQDESAKAANPEKFPSHGGKQEAKGDDPFASAPDFGDVPVDDDIPF